MKDIGGLLKQAQEMQSKIADLQKQLEEIEVAGQSGGGMVTVTLNGKGLMLRVSVDPSFLKPDDREVVEDLIVAAHNDAKAKLEQRTAEEMSKLTGSLGLPAGLKFPF
jgi:hypothetical protein